MHAETIRTHCFEDKILITATVLWLIFLASTGIIAQEKQAKQYQPAKQPSSETAPANSALVISPDEDYLIGPSDIIEIKIEDAPELSGIFRLNAKGTFTLPEVGQVSTEKKTTEEVARTIADKLRGQLSDESDRFGHGQTKQQPRVLYSGRGAASGNLSNRRSSFAAQTHHDCRRFG